MELIIILLIAIINGVLAMAEAAFIRARKARLTQLAEDGNRRAAVTLEMMADPNRFLSTTQIGITLIGILAGAFGGATVADSLAAGLREMPALRPYAQPLAIIVVVLLTTYLSLVIGELVPKRLALQNPERISMLIIPAMRTLATISAPAVRFLGFSTDAVLRLLGARPPDEPPVTEQEIRALIREGIQAGVFEEADEEMVAGVFSLGDRRVDQLMTPRTEIAWLNLDDDAETNRQKLIACPHSRLPVAHDSLDRVIGVVRAKDILNRLLTGEPFDIKGCVRPPLYIPESTTAARALELFRQSGKHIALVIDEHGGLAGLVTIYDLLEEIVGDIETHQAVQRPDGSWLLDGLLPVDDLRDLFELAELPGEEEGLYQTLGGFIMAELGRIPNTGDRVVWRNLTFEVVDMDARRVDKVLASANSPTSASAAPPSAPQPES